MKEPIIGDRYLLNGLSCEVVEVSKSRVKVTVNNGERIITGDYTMDEFIKREQRSLARGAVFEPATSKSHNP